MFVRKIWVLLSYFSKLHLDHIYCHQIVFYYSHRPCSYCKEKKIDKIEQTIIVVLLKLQYNFTHNYSVESIELEVFKQQTNISFVKGSLNN